MLSETFMLRRALEEAGLTMSREHPRVKSPGATTGPCLRVALKPDGGVSCVASVSEEEWSGLWTVMEGNQNSFPVVRIKEPLVPLSRDHQFWQRLLFDDQGKRKKKPKENIRLDVLADALATKTCCLSPKAEGDWHRSRRFVHWHTPLLICLSPKAEADWRRLREKTEELLEHSNTGDLATATLPLFSRRFQRAAANPSRLLFEIGTLAVQMVREGRLDKDGLDAVETLIVGKGPPDVEGVRPKMTIQFAFDLESCPTDSYRLYSQQVRKRVIEVLPAEQRNQAPGNVVGSPGADRCAFTGQVAELQASAFPSVKLPVLNKAFPLVSMFSDAACNMRYGLTDAFVVPVAKEAVRRMQDALVYILSAERKSRTWRGIASGKFETKGGRKRERMDLLIVYVDGKPNIDAMVAEMFGVEEGEQRKQFEVDARVVCDALDGIEREKPGSKMNLFILRKASEGQAHVAVADSFSITEVLTRAKQWQQGAMNVPDVVVPLPGEKGRRAVPERPGRLTRSRSCGCSLNNGSRTGSTSGRLKASGWLKYSP